MSDRRPPRRLLALLGLASLAFTGVACGDDDDSGDQEAEPGEVRVDDNVFEPSKLEVAVGDTVTWTWVGEIDHNVVGDGFESETQDEGTFEHEFSEPGTYDYMCTIHPGMKGEIEVV